MTVEKRQKKGNVSSSIALEWSDSLWNGLVEESVASHRAQWMWTHCHKMWQRLLVKVDWQSLAMRSSTWWFLLRVPDAGVTVTFNPCVLAGMYHSPKLHLKMCSQYRQELGELSWGKSLLNFESFLSALNSFNGNTFLYQCCFPSNLSWIFRDGTPFGTGCPCRELVLVFLPK